MRPEGFDMYACDHCEVQRLVRRPERDDTLGDTQTNRIAVSGDRLTLHYCLYCALPSFTSSDGCQCGRMAWTDQVRLAGHYGLEERDHTIARLRAFLPSSPVDRQYVEAEIQRILVEQRQIQERARIAFERAMQTARIQAAEENAGTHGWRNAPAAFTEITQDRALPPLTRARLLQTMASFGLLTPDALRAEAQRLITDDRSAAAEPTPSTSDEKSPSPSPEPGMRKIRLKSKP